LLDCLAHVLLSFRVFIMCLRTCVNGNDDDDDADDEFDDGGDYCE